MMGLLDGDTVFADILMMSKVDARIVILVEGEEDTAVLDPHLNERDVRSEIGFGKKAVLRVAELAKSNSLGSVLSIVDRDFDDETEIRKKSDYISVSEYYDIHTDIAFRCPSVIARVVSSHSRRHLYAPYLKGLDETAVSAAAKIAGAVGLLRQQSVSGGLELNLSKFPTATLIEAFEDGFVEKEVARIALRRSVKISMVEQDLEAMLLSLSEGFGNLNYFCNSHDIISALTGFINNRWGGRSAIDGVARSFRSAVGCECISKLRLFRELEVWGVAVGVSVWSCIPPAHPNAAVPGVFS